MRLTKANVNEIKKETNNKLTKKVCNYIMNKWSDYTDKKGIFTDVLRYGCISGIVGELIYYSDTVAFYNKYKNEINELLAEQMWNFGASSPCELFGDKWENEDPLANDTSNQNLLAWFGFEETLRNIGLNFEELEGVL